MAQVFAILVLEDDTLPAVHFRYPGSRGLLLPPGVGPGAVDVCGLGPAAAVRDQDGAVVGPDVSATGIRIAVEAGLQPSEILPAPRTALLSLTGISSQSVPGLLQRSVVAAEIQAFSVSDEGKTVGGRVARVLQIELPELLRRCHIKGPGRNVGDRLLRVVEQLSAGMGGQQPEAFRQGQVSHERILQFAHDGVRLPVFHAGGEAQPAFLQRHSQLQAHLQRVSLADQPVIGDPDHAGLRRDRRLLGGRRHFDFLSFQGVVIQAPESLPAGIVRAGLPVPQGQHPTVLSDHDGRFFVLETNSVRQW